MSDSQVKRIISQKTTTRLELKPLQDFSAAFVCDKKMILHSKPTAFLLFIDFLSLCVSSV